MDPLSIAASTAALLHVAHKVSGYGQDVWSAKEDRIKMIDEVRSLKGLQALLIWRVNEAVQTKDQWFEGVLSLVNSATVAHDGGKLKLVPDPSGQAPGILVRVDQMITDLNNHSALKPGHVWRKYVYKLLWHHDKKELTAALDEMARLRSHLDSALNHDHFKLSEDTNKHVKQVEDHVRNIKSTGTDTNKKVLSIKNDGVDTNSRVKTIESTGIDTYSRVKTIESTGIDTNKNMLALKDDGVDTNSRVQSIEKNLEALRHRGDRQENRAERKKIIQWLSPLEFVRRQAEIFNDCVQNTGKGLLESEEFQAWSVGRPWSLYCYGQPGAGKTVLSSIVVHYLKKKFEKQDVPVLCIYFNYKESKNQTHENLVGSLLKQLVQHQGDRFQSEELRRIYEDAHDESRPMLSNLYEVLRSEILNYIRVYIVMDALDECPKPIESRILKQLQLLSDNTQKLSLMITSRPAEVQPPNAAQVSCSGCSKKPLKLYYHCDDCNNGEFDLCQGCIDDGVRCLDQSHLPLVEPYTIRERNVEATENEIKAYVRAELYEEWNLGASSRSDSRIYVSTLGTTALGRLCQASSEFEEEIIEAIVERARGMFLLARLYMNSLRATKNVKEVRDVLQDLPPDAMGIYNQVMTRIKDPLARRVLSWIVCAHRPLSLPELQHALAVDLNESTFDQTALLDKEVLLEMTAGLVTVSPDKDAAVRLVHQTAQEYFNNHRKKWFPDAEVDITLVALHYLSYKELSRPCPGDREDEEFNTRKRKRPFLAYAYQHWGDHAHAAGSDLKVQTAVAQFLQDSQKISSTIQALWHLESTDTARWDVRKDANGLHVCAWFDLAFAIPELLQHRLQIDSSDNYGQTPLMYACKRGHTTTVTKLLELGADVNICSSRHSNAMFEAVEEDRIEVVKVLLSKPELLINSPHLLKLNQTALMLTVQEGKTEIVKTMLKRKDLVINQRDSNNDTALCIATMTGNDTIVEMILQREDVDVNLVGNNGNSALILAAKGNCVDIADQLLSKGADSSIKDREGGGTALSRAVDEGNIGMLETLLTYEIDIQRSDKLRRDDLGRGLLHAASVNGHSDLVRLLINKGLDKDTKDRSGRTPLHDASREGKPDVTKGLLELGADPLIEDNIRRTPWTVAWQNGQVEILRILENKPEISHPALEDLSQYPKVEELPIWSLAKMGHNELVSKAISNEKDRTRLFELDPDTSDNALHCAVKAKQPEILQMLLKVGMSPDPVNDRFQTPLHLAVIYVNLPAINILLEYDAKLDLPDAWGQSPFFRALVMNYVDIALALVEAGASIDSGKIQANKIQFLFFAAVISGCPKAVERLLQNGADVQAKDLLGQSALAMAKEAQYGEDTQHLILKLLRTNKSFFQSPSVGSYASERSEAETLTPMTSPFMRSDLFDEPTSINQSSPSIKNEPSSTQLVTERRNTGLTLVAA